MNIQRLTIKSKDFYRNPKRSITNLLGVDIELINYIKTDIVSNDDEIIIDAFYKKLTLNPYEIYFIDKKEMKPLTPSSGTFIIKINDIDVKVKTNSQNKIIPIRIFTTSDDKMFKYFGQVVRNPLTHFQTNMKYPNSIYLLSNFTPKQLYPADYKPSSQNQKKPVLSPSQEILTEIPADLHNGILIHPNNLPPPSFILDKSTQPISSEDIELFSTYMKIETINYYNYRYLMET